jgi:hypothetical protein
MGWFSDAVDAVSSAASAVGDAVEDTVDAVVDTVEDAVDTVVDGAQSGLQAAAEWVCKEDGDVGCAVGNVLGGLIDGALQGIQDLLHDAFDIVRDLGGIVGSILRLDLPGLLHDLGALVIDVLDLVVDGVRFALGGYFVGGIVRYFKRSMLREFVDELVHERFGDDPAELATIRDAVGLSDERRFGFRLPSEHRVFVLDSDTVPLWQMHRDEEIDLYAMAHLLSFDSFAIGAAHPNTVVKTVGSDGSDNLFPITRWAISHHLESQGAEYRLRVYSMDRRTVASKLEAASRKLEEIGVILEWNDGDDYSWFRSYTRQEVTRAEYDFNTLGIESLLGRPEFRRPAGINCNLLGVAGFKLDNLGRVAGRDILECDDFPDDCATPDRSDRCCITVRPRRSSGVIYQDAYPSDIFSYVLPHEIGHYLGLCHCGHDGFQHVMYTSKSLDFFDWGLVSYYWESEPHFTLEDGKNAWRFIVDQLPTCIGAKEGPVVEIAVEVRRAIATKPETCAVPETPEKVPAGSVVE